MTVLTATLMKVHTVLTPWCSSVLKLQSSASLNSLSGSALNDLSGLFCCLCFVSPVATKWWTYFAITVNSNCSHRDPHCSVSLSILNLNGLDVALGHFTKNILARFGPHNGWLHRISHMKQEGHRMPWGHRMTLSFNSRIKTTFQRACY